MGKSTVKPKPPSMSPGHHEKWKTCYHCDAEYLTCELKYDSGGTTAPVEDEVLTGADSGHTGVVIEVEDPISGAWADGDATGFITLDTLTGHDGEQLTMFEDNEAINGSATGAGDNCLTADGEGQVHIGGIFYPKRLMQKYEGRWYCIWHYKSKTKLRELDKQIINISEEERGRE